jgi:hypothetical protein
MFSNHDRDSSHAYLTTFTGTGRRSRTKSAAKIPVTLVICVTDISVTLRQCPSNRRSVYPLTHNRDH